MTNEPELMGTAAVAALLGVSRQRVLQLAQQPGLPEPVAVLSMGKVWRASTVRAWASDTGRGATVDPGVSVGRATGPITRSSAAP